MWKLPNVKLLEHGIKVIERLFEKYLKNIIKINEMQMGLMPGRGTIHAIFILWHMLEKYEMAGRKFFATFVNLEKPFDCF